MGHRQELIDELTLEVEKLKAELSQTQALLTLEHQKNLMLQEELSSLHTLGSDFE